MGIVETKLRNRSTWEGIYYRIEARGREKKTKKGGGIAVMVKKNKGWEIQEIEIGTTEDHEDIQVYLMGNKKLNIKQFIIICVYMTTGNIKEIVQENNRKYNIIKKVIRENKEKEILIMGDMNGHVGILGEKIDKNGELLLSFAEECDLEIGNITIAKGKVTWKRKGGKEKSAIDYVLMNNKIRQKIKEMIIDEEGEIDTKSDHNMIITKYTVKENKNIEKRGKQERKWKRKNVD